MADRMCFQYAAMACFFGWMALNGRVEAAGASSESPALYSVKDFGAAGDGKTDDTDAIQRCITTTESTHKINYSASTGESSYPEIIFPDGVYVISRPIVIGADLNHRGLMLRGQGSARIRQIHADSDVFYFHYAYRHWVENLAFEGGRRQLKFHSHNLDCAHITVKNCRFIGASDYAIDDLLVGPSHEGITPPYEVRLIDGLPRAFPVEVDHLPDVYFNSTMLRVTGSSFERCMKVLRATADWAVMDRCEIETHPDMTGAAIYARGTLKLDRVTGLAHPRQGRSQRWIDNINGGVILTNVRFDAEGATGMCAVHNRRIYDNGGQYQAYVIAEDSIFKAGGSPENCIVYCEEIPNAISIENCRETSGGGVAALGFRQQPTESYFKNVSFPELVRRDEELARIYGWEISMARAYEISDERLEHHFSFRFGGNTEISSVLPPSMRRFEEKPLPKSVQDAEASDAREDVESPPITRRLDVRDYGARGDRRTDDTDALQRACDAAARHPGTELLMPNGIYRVSAPIRLPSRLSLRGLGGAVFVSDEPIDSVLVCENAENLRFTNLAFARVPAAVVVRSRAEDECGIRFENCQFNLIAGPAVVCQSGGGQAGTPNRTRLRITDCTFVRNHQVLTTNADRAVFEYNWVSGSRDVTDGSFFVNRGTLVMADSVGVPGLKGQPPGSTQRWVDNYQDLEVDHFRFGAEAGGACNVVHKNRGGRVRIKNSWVHARGSKVLNAVVYCEQLPDLILLSGNVGIPADTQKMLFVQSREVENLTGRFFESGNTLPPSVGLIETSKQP